MAWTDNRDVVAGTDPRDVAAAQVDGNDVKQCRVDGGPDTCPDAGGLNRNIYEDLVVP